ncbi:MAG: carboxypeptidase-like regulatory domain-containing protein [Bacteroidota bacterium]|nr:carboxypeptidase-like regulatory domain-containing protein [Bacteroidota bacterium]
MRRFSSSAIVASLFVWLSLVGPAAHAQVAFASRSARLATGPGTPAPALSPADATAETVLLSGKIANPTGPLAGAVVILTGTRQLAATNAAGEFQFVVPANAGPLAARVTYAGYADENIVLNGAAGQSTVTMSHATATGAVARRQRLKGYLKTARRQVRRSLRQIRA